MRAALTAECTAAQTSVRNGSVAVPQLACGAAGVADPPEASPPLSAGFANSWRTLLACFGSTSVGMFTVGKT
jgi:hypothetical protein